MVAWSLGLLLAIQAAVFVAVQASVHDNARRALAAELGVAERVWDQLLEQRAARLTQGAAVLASDFGFRAAVSTGDEATIASALENHGERIQATVAALIDLQGRVQAVSASDPALSPAFDEAWRSIEVRLAPGRQATGRPTAGRHAMVVVAGRPVLFVAVPVRTPLPAGLVAMGFEIDAKPLAELKAVTGLHASLVTTRGPQGAAILHTSLDAPPAAALLAALPLGAGDLSFGDGRHLARTRVIDEVAATPVRLVLTGSVERAVAPYAPLQVTLAALTLAGVVAFGAASWWAARRVTRPLERLVQASRRVARGDYETPIEADGRRDEVGALGRAFEQMRASVAAHEHEIRQLAYWDRLTGLPNRQQFREAIQAALATPGGVAVVMLDLDRFKHVNDVLGYAYGDRLLRQFAHRLSTWAAAQPGAPLVARLGSDEFALLLPGASAEAARDVASGLQATLESPVDLDDQRVDVSASFGIARAPEHADQVDALLSHVEVAMDAAKRGRSGPCIFAPDLDRSSSQNLSLLSELREAIERDQLRLFLQPKFSVRHGRRIGAEALVRWQHPRRGMVPPMAFVPFAEQTGFIRQLTLWVFEEACRQQVRLRSLGLERLSVNLSTRDLLDLELPQRLDARLARHGAVADHFCLEITESAIMDDPQRAELTLARLAERGFKLSIDDFGTGYSSLAYLSRLPVQELKIDKSFVMAMERQPQDATIVRSTIDLAHNLGLSVVAEGVENAQILHLLDELGCDEAQGYHLGRPMPLEAFEAAPSRVERPSRAPAAPAGVTA
jgi:diguanylate cyclase (GGDEF)-like protein